MKTSALILLSIIIGFSFNSYTQCTVNYSPTQPGIYPDTLPDGMVGTPYSEDITFVMPLDTSGFDFTNFKILAISGLPFGLSWTCNAAANGCNYDPQVSQYGCLNISGTPIQPGVYPLDVSLIATLNVIGDVPTNFYTQITILPDTTSNNGFSLSGAYGCLPLTVSFTNNNPGYSAYFWDFGNGTTTTQENPTDQIYNTPGNYTVTYEAYSNTVPDYYLTEIQVLGIPNSWGYPGDLNPDIYILLYDGSMNLVYTSPVVDNTLPPITFPMPNILLANETYTVHVWDEDGGLFGADDDLGTSTFAGNGPSGSSSNGSTSISYAISAVGPFPAISSTDTVRVFGYPNTPNIDSTGLLLWTDSVNLSLQWFQNGNSVGGADSASFLATTSGDYFVVATSPSGCYASSDTITITICDTTFTPLVTQNGYLLYTDTSSYSFQWFFNGNPMAGETGQVITASNDGNYWVELTSYNGCVYSSAIQVVDYTNLNEFSLENDQLNVFPNPSKGLFTVEMVGVQGKNLTLNIVDVFGRIVHEQKITANNSIVKEKIQLNVSPGVFFIIVSDGKSKVTKRMVVR
ncbi:MAG: T9SS type A sorting domain-containing protein [Fluviicola sp.]|nr:T9SS type A sorting domain-containing protein [Fluviicola sp.]